VCSVQNAARMLTMPVAVAGAVCVGALCDLPESMDTSVCHVLFNHHNRVRATKLYTGGGMEAAMVYEAAVHHERRYGNTAWRRQAVVGRRALSDGISCPAVAACKHCRQVAHGVSAVLRCVIEIAWRRRC